MDQDVEDAGIVSGRPFAVAVAAAVAAAVLFVAWLWTSLGGRWVAFTLVDNLGETLAPLAAAVACARAGREAPFPSLADLGYLLAVPLAAAALLIHAASPQRGVAHTRRVLDGLLIATAVLTVSWQTVLGPLYQAGDGSAFEQVPG